MKTAVPTILDGRAFAARRAPLHAERAAAVLVARGRAPTVYVVGFGPADGVIPTFVARKLRACEAAGVLAVARILGPAATTADVLAALSDVPDGADGLFLEFPYPDGVDGDAAAAAIPPALDVDVMTQPRIDDFFARAGAPPVTVSAALGLLDDGGIDVAGMQGVVIAERSPFTEMFAEALVTRGAALSLVPPSATARARDAELVVVAAAQPGLVRSDEIAAGAVVVDVGYFNPGGRGDVDVGPGIAHLRALAPVPGGIGPATITMLVERVIEFAEGKG